MNVKDGRRRVEERKRAGDAALAERQVGARGREARVAKGQRARGRTRSVVRVGDGRVLLLGLTWVRKGDAAQGRGAVAAVVGGRVRAGRALVRGGRAARIPVDVGKGNVAPGLGPRRGGRRRLAHDGWSVAGLGRLAGFFGFGWLWAAAVPRAPGDRAGWAMFYQIDLAPVTIQACVFIHKWYAKTGSQRREPCHEGEM